MADHFFSGGQMPSKTLFGSFNEHLSIDREWVINGNHYAKTCRAWLDQFDQVRSSLRHTLKSEIPIPFAQFVLEWRLFFMACEELFAYNKGKEWHVYHYRLKPVHSTRSQHQLSSKETQL